MGNTGSSNTTPFVTPNRPGSSPEATTSFVARLRAGNDEAWEWCFTRWFPRLYAYAHRLTGDANAAADIAAEAFAAACRDIERYDEARGAPFQSFLYRLAHDRAVDHLRYHARRPTVGLDRPEAVTAQISTDPDEHLALEMALLQLTAEQRAVVLLRFYAGFSAGDTGRILGRPAGAVRGLQHRALRSLRRLLSEHSSTTTSANGDAQ